MMHSIRKKNLFWTKDRVHGLSELVGDGLSAGQIAKVMGITRNMVIGKITRSGLVLAGSNGGPKRQTPPPRRSIRRAVIPMVVPCDEPPAAIGEDAHLTTLTIGRNQCRYPHGDVGSPDFHFCGQKTAPGKSWCPYHHGRVFHREKVKTAEEREQINRAVAAQRKWAA